MKEDMKKNLRNVAIPGTGIPLSLWCYSKLSALVFLFFLYPLICLIAAINVGRWSLTRIAREYSRQLLCPQDWFSYWRLNCRLASYHALVTQSPEYMLEDKWTFLKAAEQKEIPVSKWLKVKEIVVKDKNEEGGMGLYFFKNATEGGDWIIQERLYNSPHIQRLLPDNAPLSTLRIITASRGGLTPYAPRILGNVNQVITAFSCVFRAGHQGASTDHSSILFDVDLTTGIIKKGTTNSHWYQLGLSKILTTPWTSSHSITHHPDNGVRIEGEKIPNMEEIVQMVKNAHYQLLPCVPLVGWDVALSQSGTVVLEVNLSCNFFRGSFDTRAYTEFIDAYFTQLETDEFTMPKKRNYAASPSLSRSAAPLSSPVPSAVSVGSAGGARAEKEKEK